MSQSPLLLQLIEALRCLPGVGPKSAQRMAFHILERDREGALKLSRALSDAVERIGHCKVCRTLSEDEVCSLCADSRREQSLICIVETPADVLAIEQATDFNGNFFVLMGHLSPLDGIGPAELGLDLFEERLKQGGVTEIILATNPTAEGETTAHYISQMADEYGVPASRLAHGIPLGGELEYVDSGTLAHAFSGRQKIKP